MTTESTNTKARKVVAVVDAQVIAEFSLHYSDRMKFDGGQWRARTPAEMGEALEQRCAEFHAFIRDHRSQDPVTLSVERVVQHQCSACHQEWDPTMEGGITYCGYCGEEVET